MADSASQVVFAEDDDQITKLRKHRNALASLCPLASQMIVYGNESNYCVGADCARPGCCGGLGESSWGRRAAVLPERDVAGDAGRDGRICAQAECPAKMLDLAPPSAWFCWRSSSLGQSRAAGVHGVSGDGAPCAVADPVTSGFAGVDWED